MTTTPDAPAAADPGEAVLFVVGGLLVALFFGSIVWRTLRRNRLRK